jgi:hypothetical protein
MPVEGSKSRRDSAERAPSPPVRPASELGVAMPVELIYRDSSPRTPSPSADSSSPESPRKDFENPVELNVKGVDKDGNRAPNLTSSASSALLVEGSKSRRDSAERAPSPPVRPASELGVALPVELIYRDSSPRTPSPSSDSELVVTVSDSSSPASPRKDFEDGNPVELNVKGVDRDGNRSPNITPSASGAFGFFNKSPDTAITPVKAEKKEDALKVQEKSSSIFEEEDVQKKDELLRKINPKNMTFSFKRDIKLVMGLCAAGNPTALYLLAQAVYKGDGALTKDPAAAWHLAQLAISRTENRESQKAILRFQKDNISQKYVNTTCGSGLKIHIADQDYDPKELQEAYLEEIKIAESKPADQAAKGSMRCSH